MTYGYITIDIKAVTNEYLAKVCPDYEIGTKARSLIYKISADIYYISLCSPEVWKELICKTQEEFIEAVGEAKLTRML